LADAFAVSAAAERKRFCTLEIDNKLKQKSTTTATSCSIEKAL